MDALLMPLPGVEPTVVLVDASPLIHLAMLGALDLPLRFGPVVVPDAVEIETTYLAGKPFAAEIAAWLDANARAPGRNRWVERPITEVGELLKIAIDTGRPRPRNVGEHAIVNWLGDHVLALGGPALIVYENGRIPRMLIREGLPEDVVVVTSRTFLQLSHHAGYLADPEAAWAAVAQGRSAGDPSFELPDHPGAQAMTDEVLSATLRLYVEGRITAEQAANALGPGTAVVDVVLGAAERFHLLPDVRDAFDEGELRRGLALLGLEANAPA